MVKTLEVPKNYGYARIGSVMNYVTREVYLRYVFDMAQLNSLGKIKWDQESLTQRVQARAYSTSSQNESSTSRATGLSIGTPLTRVGFEHHTTTSNSQLDTGKGLSLTMGMAYRGLELKLAATEDDLYRCADADFRKALDKLAAAGEGEWKNAYEEFTKTYGHGFVSGLKLICCAAGVLQMTYTTSGSEQQQRHGRSVSVARASQDNAAIASDWFNAESKSTSTGKMSSDVEALPAQSPCADWASALMATYIKLAMDAILKDPPAIPPTPANDATLPKIPDMKAPNPSKFPPVTLTNPDDMVKYMQLAQMEAEGVNVASPNAWADYQKQIHDDQKKLNKNDIAKAKPSVSSTDQAPGSAGRPDSEQPVVVAAGAKLTGPVNDIDFGNYAIYDIEVTSYKKAFKSLNWNFHAAPSRTGLNLAKIHTFIMTRQLIGSYLRFLSSLPRVFTGGYATGAFADHFETALKNCIGFVSGETITDSTYQDVVDDFHDELFTDEASKNGLAVYQCFVDHFEFLSKAPYGFLMTAPYNGNTYRPQWGHWFLQHEGSDNFDYFYENPYLVSWSGAVETSEMVKDSYRVYPIIVGGATPGIALAVYVPTYDPSKGPLNYDGWCSLRADGTVSPYPVEETWTFPERESGFGANSVKDGSELSVTVISGLPSFAAKASYPTRTPVTLTPIGFQDVEEGTVQGIPMWYEQPFESVRKSVLDGFTEEET